MSTELRTAPVADGTEPFIRALVLAGADLPTATVKVAPLNKSSVINGTNLPSGNTNMTLALMRSSPIYSNSPDSTTILLPKVADMTDVGSYVFTPNNPNGLVFLLQRLGLGAFFLNPAANVVINWGPYGDIKDMSTETPSVMLKLVAQFGVGGATADRWIAE